MTARMIARAENTAIVLARLLEAGYELVIRRRRAVVSVRVEQIGCAPRWYDAGTLDGCVAQMDELLRAKAIA